MIKGFEHTGICAKDPAAMVQWYAKHLGTKTIVAYEERNIYFIMAPNGAIFEIYPATEISPEYGNTVSGIRHLAVLVTDVEAAQREMIENGVDIDRDIPPPGDSRLVRFRDCEGNLLHLVERSAPLA